MSLELNTHMHVDDSTTILSGVFAGSQFTRKHSATRLVAIAQHNCAGDGQEMKILFLHGLTSSPGGLKPTYLNDHGHEVLNPDLSGGEFNESVRIAQTEYEQHDPDVVVGSSRGGAVAVNMDIKDTPMVLLCPAWKSWGTATTVKSNTSIIHSELDEVVSIEDSKELLKINGLPESKLIVVGHEHRLADEESLRVMLRACERVAHFDE